MAWLTTGTAAWRSWLEEPPPVAVLPHPTTTGAEEASSEDRSCVEYHKILYYYTVCIRTWPAYWSGRQAGLMLREKETRLESFTIAMSLSSELESQPGCWIDLQCVCM